MGNLWKGRYDNRHYIINLSFSWNRHNNNSFEGKKKKKSENKWDLKKRSEKCHCHQLKSVHDCTWTALNYENYQTIGSHCKYIRNK